MKLVVSAFLSCSGQSTSLLSIALRAAATLVATPSLYLISSFSRRQLSIYSRIPWMYSFHMIHLIGWAAVVADLDRGPCGFSRYGFGVGSRSRRLMPTVLNPGHALSARQYIPAARRGAPTPIDDNCPLPHRGADPYLVACVTHTNHTAVPAQVGNLASLPRIYERNERK